MNCINNPTLLASQNPVLMHFFMAPKTKSRKVLIKTQPLANSPRLVVDMIAFGFLAPLAYRVESQIGFLNLCILLVFTLALGGCAPQPAAALEALRSFQGSF
jgi:hypothetical protein